MLEVDAIFRRHAKYVIHAGVTPNMLYIHAGVTPDVMDVIRRELA